MEKKISSRQRRDVRVPCALASVVLAACLVAAQQGRGEAHLAAELTPEQRRIADDVIASVMAKVQLQIVQRERLAESIAELAKREKKPQGWVPAAHVGNCARQCRARWEHVPLPAAIDEKVVEDIIFQYRNPVGASEHDIQQHREECIRALAAIGHPKAVPIVIEGLKEKSSAAWAALWEMADEAFVPVIAEHIDLKDPSHTRAATKCLGKVGKAGIPLLKRLLQSPDAAAKRGAMDALADICLPECLAPLEELARSAEPRDKDLDSRLAAAIGTIRCRAIDETYVPPRLPYEDECRLHHLAALAVRHGTGNDLSGPAEAALLKLARPIAAAALRPQLSSLVHGDTELGPHYFASKQAAELMVRIGDAAIPALLDALNDQESHARGYAAQALRRVTGADLGTDYAAWRAWCVKSGKLK